MNLLKKLRGLFLADNYFYFVFIPFLTLIFIIMMLLMCYPSVASAGVKNGVEICLNMLIPSLFPFMFFSSIISNTVPFNFKSKGIRRLTRFVFGLPGESLPIIIMSLIGGFPVGAYLVKDAYEDGRLSSREGKRMLLFCVNPGLAFSFSMLGNTLFSSSRIGLIIFAVSVISSVFLGILARFFEEGEDYQKNRAGTSEHIHISKIAADTMNNCIRSMVTVCVWVIIFSCISSLVEALPLAKGTSDFLNMISEVTNGSIVAKNDYSFPVLCGVVGFGGFCIHMQIMPALTKLKLKYKYFFCSRILCCAMNSVLAFFFMKIFPLETEVSVLTEKPQKAAVFSSVPLCVFLMIMCGLFVLGDGYTVWKKQKNVSGKVVNKPQLY